MKNYTSGTGSVCFNPKPKCCYISELCSYLNYWRLLWYSYTLVSLYYSRNFSCFEKLQFVLQIRTACFVMWYQTIAWDTLVPFNLLKKFHLQKFRDTLTCASMPSVENKAADTICFLNCCDRCRTRSAQISFSRPQATRNLWTGLGLYSPSSPCHPHPTGLDLSTMVKKSKVEKKISIHKSQAQDSWIHNPIKDHIFVNKKKIYIYIKRTSLSHF